MANASAAPKPGTRKVTIGAIGGAVVTVLVYALDAMQIAPVKDLPPEVYAAAGTLVTALLVYMTSETYT